MAPVEIGSRGELVTTPYFRGQKNIENSFFVKNLFLVVFRDGEHELDVIRLQTTLRDVICPFSISGVKKTSQIHFRRKSRF